jgi:hypothetical protein
MIHVKKSLNILKLKMLMVIPSIQNNINCMKEDVLKLILKINVKKLEVMVTQKNQIVVQVVDVNMA